MQTTYDGFLQNVFADDIYWGCKLIECLPPGPENEAGRPNSYGQPKVQQRMRIINDDHGADDYNSHGSESDHDNNDGGNDYKSHVSDHDNDNGGGDYDVN